MQINSRFRPKNKPFWWALALCLLVLPYILWASGGNYNTEMLRYQASLRPDCVPSGLDSANEVETIAAALAGCRGYESARTYPVQTAMVLSTVGGSQLLVDVLRTYGYIHVIPVVYSNLVEGSTLIDTQVRIGRTWEATKKLAHSTLNLSFDVSDFTGTTNEVRPATRALLTLLKIQKGGHGYLSQWKLIQGVGDLEGEMAAEQLIGQTIMNTTEDVLLGETLALEAKYRAGEATWGDLGWSVVEIGTLALGGLIAKSGKLKKGTKAARVVQNVSKSNRLARATALTGKVAQTVTKSWKVIAAVGITYTAVMHPRLMATFIKKVGEVAGLPGLAVVFGFVAFVFLPFLWFGFLILKIVSSMFGITAFVTRKCDESVRRRYKRIEEHEKNLVLSS